MNGRKPTKAEQKWINAIMEHGCVVCRNEFSLYTPAELHHLNGGSNHMDTLPLCFHHHNSRMDTMECTSRHPHKAIFEQRYGDELEMLDKLRLEIGDYD